MLEVQIEDWKMLIDHIEHSVKNYPDPTTNLCQWRGQSKATWKLVPSLSRILAGENMSEKKALGYENQSKLDFKAQAHLLDPSLIYDSVNPNGMLIDMQHYSCPTRLLDWTFSPYIALFFAVYENFDFDGALFLWHWYQYYRNYNKVYPDKKELDVDEITEFTEHPIVSLVHAQKKNERIVRQQGTFSLSNKIFDGHDDLIIEMGKKANERSGLLKLSIPNHLKLEFLSRLKIMNITSESLFPGLDGLGRSIREQLLMRKWKGV